MSYHLPNIKHRKTLTPEDYIYRVNLYATWIHLLDGMIQSVAGQWQRFARAADKIKGCWQIQSDANKVSSAIRQASAFLDRYTERLDQVDLAEWKAIREKAASVHDRELDEINRLIILFGKYYITCFGDKDKWQKVFDLLCSMQNGAVSDDAVDIYAINYIYTLNLEDEKEEP